MYRWQATSNPQHMLPGSAARACGTIPFARRDEQSKPAHRRRT